MLFMKRDSAPFKIVGEGVESSDVFLRSLCFFGTLDRHADSFDVSATDLAR
jgi:hypothetical protein